MPETGNIKYFFKRIINSPVTIALALNALLVHPAWIHRASLNAPLFGFWYEREIFTLFWISIDLLAILTLLYLTRNSPWHRWISRIAIILYEVLLAFEIYGAVIQQLFHRPPVLYNDIFLIVDALYLILNFGWGAWLVALGLIGLIILAFGWLIPWMFRAVSVSFRESPDSTYLRRIGILLWIGVALVQIDWGIHKRDAAAQLISYRLGQSIGTSLEYYHTMQSTDLGVLTDKYSQFASQEIANPPNVYLFVFESYGKVLLQRDDFSKHYLAMLGEFRDSLATRGWRAVTNYSDAPVNGGGSWMSSATILSGLWIANEPLYHKFIESESPNLVRILKSLGYHTVYLGPANRARPGIPIRNPYGFDRLVEYNDLHYRGRPYGWGMIPDQYSLFYANYHYLETVNKPVLLYFTSLATHTMWKDRAVPPVVEDWRSLNTTTGEDRKETLGEHLKIRISETLLQPYKPDNFLKLIRYDLRVFQRFITGEIPENSVIVIVGDHQPPLVTRQKHGTETILHIISRDTTLLGQFPRDGFARGFRKDNDASGAVRHDDIFPILMRNLRSAYAREDVVRNAQKKSGNP